mgnify:CR=1 FL=1
MFVNSYHQVVVTGKVVKDIELKTLQNGQSVVNLAIPTNNVIRENGETTTVTTWFKVVLYAKTAEITAAKVNKGDYVMVRGHLKPEIAIWQSPDGPKASYEVLADEIIFLNRE